MARLPPCADIMVWSANHQDGVDCLVDALRQLFQSGRPQSLPKCWASDSTDANRIRPRPGICYPTTVRQVKQSTANAFSRSISMAIAPLISLVVNAPQVSLRDGIRSSPSFLNKRKKLSQVVSSSTAALPFFSRRHVFRPIPPLIFSMLLSEIALLSYPSDAIFSPNARPVRYKTSR